MKTIHQDMVTSFLLIAATLSFAVVSAQPLAPGPLPSPAPAAEKSNSHLKLCAQLGLKVGRTYEMMSFNNEEVHYWTIRSLGGRGWILVEDSRHSETWLNLSQLIAVTPVTFKPSPARPEKSNRSLHVPGGK